MRMKGLSGLCTAIGPYPQCRFRPAARASRSGGARTPGPTRRNIPGGFEPRPAPIGRHGAFRVPTAQSRIQLQFCLSGQTTPCLDGGAPRWCGLSPWAGPDRPYRQLLLAGAGAANSCGFDCRQPLARMRRRQQSRSGASTACCCAIKRRARGGQKSRAYPHRARIPPQQPIVQPWDVVINAFLLGCCNLRRSEASALNKLATFFWVGAPFPEKNILGNGFSWRLCHLSAPGAAAGACA